MSWHLCGTQLHRGRAKLRLSRSWRVLHGSDGASPYRSFALLRLLNKISGFRPSFGERGHNRDAA
jgi:hypothetical protein